MISESRFNLNIAIVVNSLFPAASLVREVNILSQSQSDLCVVILHLQGHMILNLIHEKT